MLVPRAKEIKTKSSKNVVLLILEISASNQPNKRMSLLLKANILPIFFTLFAPLKDTLAQQSAILNRNQQKWQKQAFCNKAHRSKTKSHRKKL